MLVLVVTPYLAEIYTLFLINDFNVILLDCGCLCIYEKF